MTWMASLQSGDRQAQWRLDYTNCHVETDADSECTDDRSLDSRRSSSVFSSGGGRLEPSTPGALDAGLSSGEEDRALGMLDCDPSSFIFPQDLPDLRAGGVSGGVSGGGACAVGGLSQLLTTPALSTVSCRTWSSYDEISTPSVASCSESARPGRHHRGMSSSQLPRNNSLVSNTTSIASTTELLYGADMSLLSKNKISDKPVKCLLLYMCEGIPLVLSFSGCHSDDEAVLKWSREKDEMLWTNDPILEYNPATKMTRMPSYMKARLSSSSSTQSIVQRSSQSSQ